MNRKSRNLSTDDRKAIDLLLDHGAARATGPTRVTAAASQTRIAACSRLLSMLDTLPAIEPPADLVARTMGRIDAAAARPAAVVHAPAISAQAMH